MTGPDETAERAAILQLHADWIAAETQGDIDAMLALCAPDVILQPPIGQPVAGIGAVGETLHAGATQIEAIDIADMTLDIAPDFAVKRARFATWLPARTEPITGWHLWLLRPRWQVAYVTWSLDRLPE